MSYNNLYERLIDNDESPIRGFVAYALYKSAKREWIKQHMAANNNQSPSTAEIAAYAATYTPVAISGLQAQAEQILVN